MVLNITVVIVNWNGERFLDRCLSALLVQTYAPREIILVDNASTDRSLEIVRRFPSVKLIACSKNLGFARGNNLAIDSISGDSGWVALLNPDAYAKPDWLEKLADSAQAHPCTDFFASKLIVAGDPSLLDGAGDAYHVSGLAWRMGHMTPVDLSPQKEREVFSPCAAAAMYRLEALREVGGFDEDFFCYLEDVDLGFRLRIAGYRCLYVPASVAYHVGSGTTGGKHSDFSVYHGHRNLVWTYVKNMPNFLFWVFLPLHLAMNLLALAVFSMRGQAAVIWRAKLDAVLGLPGMWAKRGRVQKMRRVSWQTLLGAMAKRLS